MERLRILFRQREFHALLFCGSLVLLSWPLVSFSDVNRLQTMFVYLFLAWAAIVLLLFLVSRSLDAGNGSDDTESGSK
ncbi:MAG: hypothetical protein HY913_02105 [Desulfomonile tiedjei]|nr:hypothetical protein [Desulfomonile tiedjei]